MHKIVKLIESNITDSEMIESNLNNKITIAIVKYRVYNLLTRQDMAKVLNISYSKYLKIENKYYDFKLSEIVSFMNILNIDIRLDIFDNNIYDTELIDKTKV